MIYSERATQYARDVVAGSVLACRWIILACQRHLNDLEAGVYSFDDARANKACKFIALLPHTKGKWALGLPGKPGTNLITLEPWQIFVVCSIFGWLRADGLRRYRKVYINVPRKNGKSFLAAAIGLYMLVADGEFGAEIYSGATSEKQAWEVFRPARLMAQRAKSFTAHFGVEVNASNINVLQNGSRFEPIIGKPGDGASPSCAIIDEYHEHDSDELLDTMVTGMGAREQPLLLVITTAGVDLAGPCYALQLTLQKVLEGALEDEEFFGVIYTIDADCDWTSEAALQMANPNFDVSVSRDFLLSRQREAVLSSRKQNIFKTKHLNIWCGARDAFFNLESWLAQADAELSIDAFEGDECWGALDLASKIDIADWVLLFRREVDGENHYYVFAWHYLPEDTASDPEKQHYLGWVHDGLLISTEGNIIDQNRIKADILAGARKFSIQEFGYDPFGATKLAVELLEDGVTMVEISQQVRYLSEPMKWLDALTLAGRIHHTGDPVLTWMMSNVTAKVDVNDNVFPRKEKPENKIDGAVATIMALGRALADEGNASPYNDRGLLLL